MNKPPRSGRRAQTSSRDGAVANRLAASRGAISVPFVISNSVAGKRMSQRDRKAYALSESRRLGHVSQFSASRPCPDPTHQSVRASVCAASKRKNLYAFALPAGSGKTTLAKKHGFIDVDDLVDEASHASLVDSRMAAQQSGKWDEHNRAWYALLNRTLSWLDLSRPTVILVHHEEAAFEIGAELFCSIYLDLDSYHHNIASRSGFDRTISLDNYASVKASGRAPVREVHGTSGAEQLIVSELNKAGLPTIAPLLAGPGSTNPWFKPGVPKNVLSGAVCDSVDDLIQLIEGGLIPKECADYQMRKISQLPAVYGFGYTMNHWAAWFGELAGCVNDQTDFDVNGDMLEVFPPREQKELHRANLTIRRLFKAFNLDQMEDAISIMRAHVGEPHIFVTGVLTQWFFTLDKMAFSHLLWPLVFCRFSRWPAMMKSLHTMVRTSNFFMNTQMSVMDKQGLMYMDLLVGREDYDIDLDEQLALRNKRGLSSTYRAYDPVRKAWTRDEYERLFAESMNEGFRRIVHRPRQLSFSNFWDFYYIRKTWLTGGSLVYNHISKEKLEYNTAIIDDAAQIIEATKKHNKGNFFEVHDIQDAIRGMDENNFNLTKVMKKWETGGKHRILLPGTLAHYLVFSYIIYYLDRQEQYGVVRLNAPYDEHYQYTEAKMHSMFHHLAYDWTDFNEEHSAGDMAKVLDRFQEIMVAPQDWYMMARAAVVSFSNMGIIDAEGGLHVILSGLMSGWRITSTENNWLNHIYTSIGLKTAENLFGRALSARVIDSGGDDRDDQYDTGEDAFLMYYVMDRIGFRANSAKQMVGKSAEFFRVTTTASGSYASRTRGLASFIAGDWENSRHISPVERVAALMDQIAQLGRRGMPETFCTGAKMAVVAHWCRVKDGTQWLDLPREVIHGQQSQGGLGVPDGSGDLWVLSEDVPPLSTLEGRRQIPGKKASTDYITDLSKGLTTYGLAFKSFSTAVDTLAEGVFDFPAFNEIESLRPLLGYKGKAVSYIKAVKPCWDSDLFETFLGNSDFEDDNSLYKAIDRYSSNLSNLSHDGKALTREEAIEVLSAGKVKPEAYDFQGNIYYRRLCAPFLANKAARQCRAMLNIGHYNLAEAEQAFKIICYMAAEVFDHHV